ncbi:MAG: hypothetical protein ACRD3W_26190, partial [Terriglobales bacterium]
ENPWCSASSRSSDIDPKGQYARFPLTIYTLALAANKKENSAQTKGMVGRWEIKDRKAFRSIPRATKTVGGESIDFFCLPFLPVDLAPSGSSEDAFQRLRNLRKGETTGDMRRRDFMAALAASALAARWPASAQVQLRHPRLLIADADPFTGLPLLKARYSAGSRPSEDMEGWALSWRLTGQDSFAERALDEMRTRHIGTGGKPSRSWLDYTRWALAFDWLSGYRGFDRALQDRVAGELRDGAAAMLSTADFADPGAFSYQNYALRYLTLAAFASAAVEEYPGCDERCAGWRDTEPQERGARRLADRSVSGFTSRRRLLPPRD